MFPEFTDYSERVRTWPKLRTPAYQMIGSQQAEAQHSRRLKSIVEAVLTATKD